ncbi:MAG: hypothetical protein A2Y17_09785 [Clostridiales bacterium GWF2_38_85]|nr:MAG: hypothetical protein A2Y17_09785 [Clostridiales bacterium GWF2_38_85]
MDIVKKGQVVRFKKGVCMKRSFLICWAMVLCAFVDAEPPFLQWQSSNCWLISLVHVLYNMPEFVDQFVGVGGDGYVKNPSQEKYAQVAKSFTELIRDIDSHQKKNSPSNDHYSGLLKVLQTAVLLNTQEGLEWNPEVGFNEIAEACGNQASLWKLKYGDIFYNSFYFYSQRNRNKEDVYTVSEFFDASLNMFYGGGEKVLLGLSNYIVLQGSYSSMLNGKLPLILDMESVVSSNLKKGGESLRYELTGIVNVEHEYGGHFTAYVKDQYDPAHPWYFCDEIGKTLVVVSEAEALGPWAGDRRPELLVYRRIDNSVDQLARSLKAIAEGK